MDTVRAACALDYPPEFYRVVVLDDGGSKLIQDSVERLSREQAGRNLYYASRDVKVRSFSKNGNMNFGLEFVAGLPSGPSEFVAVLDIDMIPLPFWLRAVLPYLVSDSKVGLASPSQRFYNIPNRDPFFQSLDMLSDGVETIKDCVSSSWCKSSDQSYSPPFDWKVGCRTLLGSENPCNNGFGEIAQRRNADYEITKVLARDS